MRLRLSDPGWILTLVAAAAALSVATTLIVARLVVPSEQAVIRTPDWPWLANGVVVEPSTIDSPFKRGDVVVSMNGRSLESWADDLVAPPWTVERRPMGPVVTFEVVRDGTRIALEAALLPLPGERVRGAPLGLLGFGAGALLLAVVLVARRPRATSLRLLFIGVTANTADLVAWELDLQPTDLALATPFVYTFAAASLFNLLFWSSLIHLLSIYPVRSGLVVRWRAAVALIYVVPFVAFAIGVVAARLAGGTVLDWIDRLAAVHGGVASGQLLLIVASIAIGYRRTPEPRRRQVRLIAATLSVAAGATLLLVALPIALAGQPLAARNVIALLALPVLVALALAVIRDRLFQVDFLVRSRERIVAAREEERRRLRRDLHDGLGPTLAALGLKLDLAREHARDRPDDVGPLLDELRSDVRAVIGQIRTMARELRPPTLDALGLVGAIREQAGSLVGAVAVGPLIVVEAPDDLPPLPAAIEVAAYRIVIEALTNAVRHAEATECIVRLVLDDDALVTEVRDDGRGIEPGAVGVGTRSMFERAAEVGGEVSVEPIRPRGTRVLARLPFDRTTSDREERRPA